MSHTDNNLDDFFLDIDKEFQVIENVIKKTLDALDDYEKQIEENKRN